jgi:putative transcriptional regulator
MTKRNIGSEILEGIQEIQKHRAGLVRLKSTELSMPSPPHVIRAELNLSQSAFAAMLGVSVRTLQDWEQGRRQPQGPALALLRVAEQFPEVLVNLR